MLHTAWNTWRVFVSIAAVVAVMSLAQAAHGQDPTPPADAAKDCKETDPDGCIRILAQGSDGYDEIDWDGPDVVTRSPLDFPCFDVDVEIEKFKLTTAGIASSVPTKPVTYVQAMARVQELFKPTDTKRPLATSRAQSGEGKGSPTLEEVGAFAIVQGDLSYVLTTLAARLEAAPNDPSALFSFASALTYAGMPNEAIAILDKIASTKSNTNLASAFPPGPALDYLRGYAFLMTGKLQDSQTLLSRAFAADRTLTDASYALAIAEQALGGDPRKHMLQGMLPNYSGNVVYCGDKFALDPLFQKEDQPAGPSADELFDLSKGTPGVLPQLRHPANGEQLVRMVEEMVVEAPKLLDEAGSLSQRADAIYVSQLSPRLNRESPDAQDLIDQALCDIIDETGAPLKPLQRMRMARDQRHEEMVETMDRDVRLQATKLMRLTEMGDDPSEARKALARDIVNTGMVRRRASINAYDTALRQHFRAWHKYATAVAGYITDETWRQYSDLTIQAAQATLWHSLYVSVIEGYFAQLPASRQIYEPDPPLPKPPGPPNDELWRCDESMRKASMEAKLIQKENLPTTPSGKHLPFSMAAKMNCDKFSLEGEGKLAEVDLGPMKAGVGGFIEGSVNRTNGDVTVYGGPKASGEFGPFSGSFKDGAAITVDSNGNPKEIALQVDASASAGAGGIKGSLKQFSGEGTKFTIWSAPPRPPKFDRGTGLTIWGNR